MYTCRECERPVNQATEVCPYCGADLATTPTEEAEPKRKSVLGAVLRWGLLLAAMWAFLWFILPERDAGRRTQAEAHAIEMLQEAGATLTAYKQAQGTFPVSLEALPRESSAGVREAARRALSDGYQIFYTSGPPGPDGRTMSYSLRAQAGHYGFRNFYLDQTGILRATQESRAATAEDSPVPEK